MASVSFPQINTYRSEFPRLDFSALANLPNAFWQGQEVGRENQLRKSVDEIVKSGGGFPEIVKAITAVDPIRGAQLMANFENAQALAGIRNFSALPEGAKTRALYGGGTGVPAQAEPSTPMAESVNPNGPYFAQSAPGPIAGTSTVQPSNVPVPGYTNLPEDVAKATAPVGTVELAKGRAKNQAALELKRPTDEAIVANLDDRLGRLADQAKELLTPTNQPSEGLKAITGNVEVGGYNTGIPKAWLPNVSQEARNAAAKLDSTVIQTGLAALEQMRTAAQSGASGMGQLAIEESRMLQNSVASYSQAQSPKEAATALRKVVYWTNRVRDIAKNKYKQTYGTEFKPVPASPSPADQTNNPAAADAMRMAQEALAAGKDPEAVRAKLKEMGFDLGQ